MTLGKTDLGIIFCCVLVVSFLCFSCSSNKQSEGDNRSDFGGNFIYYMNRGIQLEITMHCYDSADYANKATTDFNNHQLRLLCPGMIDGSDFQESYFEYLVLYEHISIISIGDVNIGYYWWVYNRTMSDLIAKQRGADFFYDCAAKTSLIYAVHPTATIQQKALGFLCMRPRNSTIQSSPR